MVTDAADNVYLLCRVGASSLQVDGHSLKAYNAVGIGAFPDLLLTSFSKNGQYRWSKVIGGGLNNGIGLKVHNGFVHISGYVWANDSAYFSTDSLYYHAYNGYWPQMAFLAQYDTTGVFKWLQMPGAVDSILFSSQDKPENAYWIDVAPNGDIYWLCDLVPGCLPNTTQPITQKGTYVLRYSSTGQYLSRVKLDIVHDDQFLFNGSYNEGNFIRNHQIGEYYIGGATGTSGSLIIGGDTVQGSMYLTAFNSQGQVIWKKENTDQLAVINDFKIDAQGEFYLCGSSKNGGSLFDGVIFTSPQIHSAPFVVKLNASGGNMWSKFGVTKAVSPGNTLTINNQEVAISGYHGSLYWQGPNNLDTLKAVPNQGYDAFIARFDTQSGDLLGMESAQTPFGGASYGYSITTDSEGSYYLGGNFDQQLFMGPDTLYKIGSQRSFFVAKYACGIPEAAFTVNQDSIQYIYNYTGTPADSVLWDFGDGSAPYKGDSGTHVYSAIGQYVVCATAYDASCGDTTFCKTVDVTTVSLYEQAFAEVAVYPNPTNDFLNLENLPKHSSVKLYNLNGKLLLQKQFKDMKASLDLSQLSKGVYLLELQNGAGERAFRKVMKE
ncbi:T9SS type A sorting domain-containing protein [Owenweeksia hongkongensis]|uniref:T9SS type A sorting domain-containing protein n=1 Tax=Owenweeksia hongkongensis TaxID=253245 RepID=UPI003A8F0E7F